ncbi:MAG: TetR family transcriptional regulator [Xanthomonadales bacterium]|nr:TetR family transcriptional regulator [Xanthomonadales bacterium]NIN58680.1 TetR family transcriptional regulator [Xanthomonadales bacterium]NIN74530.1 TetR family transcriptional regulator [Xanthomonadales bacterium]NIO14835.1 TetR family transcriptional regulator [Xanthomonadales bacterium]NIP11073.1 TetR family transcriptional regulator [Xanthomonadales bacterium]
MSEHPAKASPTTADPQPGSRGGERRQRILEAFHDCIITRGYAKTTLRDVAREAGMTASHLLYYFTGKDAILEHYFAQVAQRIIGRLESFRGLEPRQQIDRLSELFFAGKGITRSEIGFMLECFGVAVHDDILHAEKRALDRFCKGFLEELFAQSPCGREDAGDSAELAYAMLIGLRTAAFFDNRLELSQALRLFRSEMLSLAHFTRE